MQSIFELLSCFHLYLQQSLVITFRLTCLSLSTFLALKSGFNVSEKVEENLVTLFSVSEFKIHLYCHNFKMCMRVTIVNGVMHDPRECVCAFNCTKGTVGPTTIIYLCL